MFRKLSEPTYIKIDEITTSVSLLMYMLPATRNIGLNQGLESSIAELRSICDNTTYYTFNFKKNMGRGHNIMQGLIGHIYHVKVKKI